MKGIHPNSICGAACLMAAAILAIGCRSTSSGVNNPFLAPDRVAPPSTRVLAPGQAQPYYQGDPLPVMQSTTGTGTPRPQVADAAAGQLSSSKSLTWNAPASGTSSAPAPTGASSPWGATTQPSPPIARPNEAAVSVPTDIDSLRFALPSPIQQTAPAAVASLVGGQQTSQSLAAQPNQNISLATYNAPVADGLASVAGSTLSPTPQAASPWRSPQFSSRTSPIPGNGQSSPATSPLGSQPYLTSQPPGYPVAQVPQPMPTNPMAVDLRSVPSPPPQPGDPMPRVRVPGYDVPETAAVDNFHARTSMR